MENAINAFCGIYPNVSIEYEYLQDYNTTLLKRLQSNINIDLFITNNIQTNSPFAEYALNLKTQHDAIDFSASYPGFIRNFTISKNNRDELYAVPLSGEIRGMYVNTTLLSSLGLTIPKNYAELTHCCSVLTQAGYIPLQGNPSTFAQTLMYPYVCNIIANAPDYKTIYAKVNKCEPDVSALFREPMRRLYELVVNNYYNYKFIETSSNLFTDATEDTAALNFLNITADADGKYTKHDDIGTVAFMPGIMSMQNMINKTKADYHSAIEYTFILSPIGDNGGYAYLSPSNGIAVNRNSNNVQWAIEFINFLLSDSENKTYAHDQHTIPNTLDAMDIVNKTFSISSTQVSQLGQVSFDYGFYNVIRSTLVSISKANNPKYMDDKQTIYPFDHFMQELEQQFAVQRSHLGDAAL